jgi:hypothetical protein
MYYKNKSTNWIVIKDMDVHEHERLYTSTQIKGTACSNNFNW